MKRPLKRVRKKLPAAKGRKSSVYSESGEKSHLEELDVSTGPIRLGLPDGVEVLPAEDKEGDSFVDAAPEERTAPPSKDIIPYDPLRAYLTELSRYPRLSPEEEYALAVEFRERHELKAAYKLVSSNLWLAVKIARDYRNAARNLLDLIQEGNLGLLEAVKNFDPYRGVRFPSYAVWWIKAYIVRFLIANWRLVKIGTTQAQRKLFFNLNKEREKLERGGYFPAPKLLAEKLDVRESDVIEMQQRLGSADVSMDAPLHDDSESNLGTIIPVNQPSAEDLVAQKQLGVILQQGLLEFSITLNPKELAIFRGRVVAEEKVTLRELAEELKLSRERVRQLENRVRQKLKDYFIEHYGQSIDQLNS